VDVLHFAVVFRVGIILVLTLLASAGLLVLWISADRKPVGAPKFPKVVDALASLEARGRDISITPLWRIDMVEINAPYI
jgi:hypothetical protein